MTYSVKFTLRTDRTNSSNTCPLYLKYTFNRRYYLIPTGISLKTAQWDQENNSVVNMTRNEIMTLNGRIEETHKTSIEIIENFRNENLRYPIHSELKGLIKKNKNFISENSSPELTLKSLFEEYINYSISQRKRIGTIKVYKTTLKKWLDFESQLNTKLTPINLSDNILRSFEDFLTTTGVEDGTIGNYIKTTKSFLRFLRDVKGVKIDEKSLSVKVKRVYKSFPTLDRNQLETLKFHCFFSGFSSDNEVKEKVNLTKSEKNVGRIFTFMCSTGLSFADCQDLRVMDVKIKRDNLSTKKDVACYLSVFRKKTNETEPCNIPILDVTIEMVIEQVSSIGGQSALTREFYETGKKAKSLSFKIGVLERIMNLSKVKNNNTENLFSKISNQKFNQILKEVLRKVGFTEQIHSFRKISGQTIKELKPFYECISSHTGRRTYITLSLEADIPLDVVMDTTGHRSVGMLLRYKKRNPLRINKAYRDRISNREDERTDNNESDEDE